VAKPATAQAHALAAGREALARGRFAEARKCFEAAVEEGDSPEALEGLGTAAEWMGNDASLFDARQRAYQLYRERGSVRDAARVAIQLGWDHRVIRGEHAVANGWLQRAHQLLDPLEPGAEHGWLALREASLRLGGGRVSEAAGLTAGAAQLGRSLGDPDLELTALALQGLVLVNQGRVADGMSCLDGAAAAVVAGEMRDLSAVSYVCCYLIFACERVRDYDRAGQWCEHLAAFCERYGYEPLFAVCRTHYAGVLMSRGRWPEAERELSVAMPELETSATGLVAEAVVALGELRRRQGRLEEAGRLFRRVEQRADGQLGLALVALDEGDYETAERSAERCLRGVGEEARAARAPGLEALALARAARGDHESAGTVLAELQTIADDVGTQPLRATALAVQGVIARAAGDLETARRSLEDAVALFQRAGVPYEGARARLALARVLIAAGQRQAGLGEAAAARACFEELGADADAARAGELYSRPAASHGLTKREVEVLRLVADGLTDPQIADRLVVSEHTVHRHVANILAKLSCSSRAAAVARAAQRGAL
jgi:ATP/maltotriose-dependent transcriptional regulator MalT